MRTHQESAEVSTDQSDEDWSMDRKEPQTSRWKLLMMKKGGGGNGAASSHTLTQLLAVRGTAWGTGEDKSLNLAQSTGKSTKRSSQERDDREAPSKEVKAWVSV